MSNWIHLSLNFKDYEEVATRFKDEAFPQKRPSGIYRELIFYLKKVIDSLPDLISRYFYLFEPNPHLFLALEVKDTKHIGLIRDKINQIEKPNFIASTSIDLNTGDEGHGGQVLDFFHAACKYAFFRVSDDYKPGYYNNDEVKLVHCFGNPIFASGRNEMLFYLKCAYYRGLPLDITKECLQRAGFPPEEIDEFLKWDLLR